MKNNCSISRDELKEIVREILAEMLGMATPRDKILPTSKAWSELDYDNPDQLYEAVASGLFRVGHEVEDRRKPTSVRPRYYFNLKRCRDRLKNLPEKRNYEHD